jgi:ketosteroid isomerase-like protein
MVEQFRSTGASRRSPALFVALALGGFALGACRTVSSPHPRIAHHADSVAAHRAAIGLLAAFDSLQWEPFMSYVADDITMFFPFVDSPSRADGRTAFAARFRPFFDDGRAARIRAGSPNPPFLHLDPRDLKVQMAGDAAVVTFHLGAQSPSRRSLIFKNTNGDWKLLHWHASPAPAAPARPDTTRVAALTAQDIARYAATYSYVSGGNPREMRVFGDNGQLKAQIAGGRVVALRNEGGHAFVLDVDASIRVVFTVENGRAEGVTVYQRGETIVGKRKP